MTPIAFGVEPFSKNHDANKARFDFAAALGVKSLSADPEPDSFDSLDKLCAEYKIAIAIHPHGPVQGKLEPWHCADNILAGVKDHHPLIGACLDTGNLIRCAQAPFNKKLDPAEEVRVMGARNFGMHLKDHDNKRKTDVLYGQDGGVLDVPAVSLNGCAAGRAREVKFVGSSPSASTGQGEKADGERQGFVRSSRSLSRDWVWTEPQPRRAGHPSCPQVTHDPGRDRGRPAAAVQRHDHLAAKAPSRPDGFGSSRLPAAAAPAGQYCSLGLGTGSPHPGCQEENLKPGDESKVVRRAYSISSSISATAT